MGRYSKRAHLISRIDEVLAAERRVDRPRPQLRRVGARLSDEATAQITRQYSDGVSMSALSCGESMSEETIQLALGLHASGVSVMEIARQVGVPDSTLRLVLARHTAS